MKLEKAIELNEESEKSLRSHKFHDFADAVKLGNEALKEIQKARNLRGLVYSYKLPDETMD